MIDHGTLGLTTALALLCFSLHAGGASATSHELHGGWDSESPYQYEKTLPSGGTALTGLDIEIMRALCGKAGFRVIFEEMPWTENLREVRDGASISGSRSPRRRDAANGRGLRCLSRWTTFGASLREGEGWLCRVVSSSVRPWKP